MGERQLRGPWERCKLPVKRFLWAPDDLSWNLLAAKFGGMAALPQPLKSTYDDTPTTALTPGPRNRFIG